MLLGCSEKRVRVKNVAPWYPTYTEADPALAYQELMNFSQNIAFRGTNNTVHLHTNLRLFALSHYLGRSNAIQYYEQYTNLYSKLQGSKTHYPTEGISPKGALLALELLEYKWLVKWKTNASVLRIMPPSKSEVRDYAKMIGLHAWLDSTAKE